VATMGTVMARADTEVMDRVDTEVVVMDRVDMVVDTIRATAAARTARCRTEEAAEVATTRTNAQTTVLNSLAYVDRVTILEELKS